MGMELQQNIEAILFVAGEGLTASYIADKLGVKEGEVKAAIEHLQKKYDKDSGVQIIKYRNNYQFSTSPSAADAISAVLNPVRERNLTRAAIETMAIIAYKQPITKLEIDEIRGVSSDYGVHVLLDNNLVEVAGRKDTIGKPLLYATTDEFLKRFELENIDKLPSYEQLLDKLKTISSGADFYDSNRA
jgi:segregation and condensation protein B